MVVDTGDSGHSLYELVIMQMAMAKQATTMQTQAALKARDLDVEMCTRPWIVELSKKSRKVEEAILTSGQVKLPFLLKTSLKNRCNGVQFMNTSAPCQCRGRTMVLVVLVTIT